METTLTKDKLLFTPGPLTTSMTVKQAMLRDLGSRDIEFINTVKQVRNALLQMGEVSQAQGHAGSNQNSACISFLSIPVHPKVYATTDATWTRKDFWWL